MEFTPQQSNAITSFRRWHSHNRSGAFRLFGFAGTGKTTIAKNIASGVGGKVMYAAPTGKAAHVMQSKGCHGASTVHQLIYQPSHKSKERLRQLERQLLVAKDTELELIASLDKKIQQEKVNLSRPMWKLNLDSPLAQASLLILDESSMIDHQMGSDLMSFGVPILALGDPAQLPPVAGVGFFTTSPPDVLLTDICRQARDNPIIELAAMVRAGKRLSLGKYGTSEVVSFKDFDAGWVLDADQVLVGKNATRQAYNKRMRELKGMKTLTPEQGDKLICLRNNHENDLLNGSIWTVDQAHPPVSGLVQMRLIGENDSLSNAVAHECIFLGHKPDLYDADDADHFDYGYTITVHKSQGSQWEKVTLLDEWNLKNRNQWLYTGITRAQESVRIIT